MNNLAIEFPDGSRAFRPGESIRVRALWLLEDGLESIEAIEVRLLWHTQGKGDTDLAVVAIERIDQPGPHGAKDLAIRIPDRPYSFSGKLVSLSWHLEIVLVPSQVAQTFDIVVSPTGYEVSLGGVV